MGLYNHLFKQTVIYGLATVLPRMLSFFLVRLYTNVLPNTSDYGDLTTIMAWMVFFNVLLSYGFETSFFRFYNLETDTHKVISTSTLSIFLSSILFMLCSLSFTDSLASFVNVNPRFITYAIWILVLDAVVVIPFSKLRANKQPTKYAIIKIGNVLVNLSLNFFFLLYLPNHKEVLGSIYINNFEIGYIFIANLIASLLTFVVFVPDYIRIKWQIDPALWRKMMRYGSPILVAGLAFAINEHFDKILLGKLLPPNIAKHEVGAYSACYKIGLFMVLFRTAYTLGIEPFFFSHARERNAQQTYANITKYFVIFGSLMSLCIIVFADILKIILLDNPVYWQAMGIVPLIVFANFFLGIYTNLSVWYKLTDRTSIGAYISIVGAVITLVLNFSLIPYIGYYGSAIATIVAYGSMMIISYHKGKTTYPIPYDKPKIFAYLTLSITFSGLSFYAFRENYIIGLSLILVYTYYIYHSEKETIKHILQ